jgi:hypothetical protein
MAIYLRMHVSLYTWGKNKGPWWDTTQLLAQMEIAIDIFEEKHLGYIGAFVFD